MRNRGTRATHTALLASGLLFIGLLIPLLSSLPHVAFLPGRTLDTFSAPPIRDASAGRMNPALIDRAILVLLIPLLIGVVLLLYRASSRAVRTATLLILVLLGIGYLLLMSTSDESAPVPETDLSSPGPGILLHETAEEPDLDGAPPPVVRSLDRTRALDTLLALLIATFAVTLIAVLLLAQRRRFNAPPALEPTIIDSLARASDRILAGEDPYTVVLRCYREMLATLSAEQQIDPTYLTPREFALRLRQAGLSDDHVTELTAVFETVRYGDRVDESFASRAADCLKSIQEPHAGNQP